MDLGKDGTSSDPPAEQLHQQPPSCPLAADDDNDDRDSALGSSIASEV
jgi:hypothetical protein